MDQSHEVSGNPQPFATPSTSLTDFRHLERYPWSADQNFQAGLSSIVASHGVGLDSPELEQLVVTARRFYFLRTYNINVDPTAYQTWRAAQPASALSPLLRDPSTVDLVSNADGTAWIIPSGGFQAPSTPAAATAPPAPVHTPTFDDIVALIQSGQPIPGIRDIPDTVLTGQGSTDTTPARRKPWERSEASERTTGMTMEEGTGTRVTATTVAGDGMTGQDAGRSGGNRIRPRGWQ